MEKYNGFIGILNEKKTLFIAAACATVVLLAPLPAPFQFGGEHITLTPQGQRLIAFLVLYIVIIVTEALPGGITVALAYSWIVFFGIESPKHAASYFSHDAAWFLVGALMIAQVLVKYNLHTRVLIIIIRIMGASVKRVVLGIIFFCAIASMFISGHTIAALMLPIGLAITQESGGYSKVPKLAKLLMLSIAFGCSVGGLATPSGGGRNVVMIAYLEEFFDVWVGYGAWIAVAAPITLILIPAVWLILLALFKPEINDFSEIAQRLLRDIRTSPMRTKEWTTVAIMGVIVVLWITKSDLGIGMLALFGAMLYVLAGLARWEDYQQINWGIAMLYFTAVALGRLLISTGAAVWIGAKALVSLDMVGIDGGMPLVALGAVFMALMTQIMSDGPCIAAMGPMLLQAAKMTGTDPVVMGMAAAIASAFAFAIVLGTPPNAIVYGSGYVNAKDFLKGGIIVSIVALAILLLTVLFWWPLLGVGVDGFH